MGVRFHDAALLVLLERCLHCLNAQSGVRPHVILALQGFSKADRVRVRALCRNALTAPGVSHEIYNVPNPGNRDLRACLLNRICDAHYARGQGPYLAFIDFDDIWFQTALSTLVDGLNTGDAALSYADIHCADLYHDAGQIYLRDIRDNFRISGQSKRSLLSGNFLPLHSYMFHTGRVARDLLRYDETLTRLEDYDVLLGIAANHAFSGIYRKRLIGLYNFYTLRNGMGNSSVNIFAPGQDRRDTSDWRASERRILARHSGRPWREFWGEEWVQ